MILDIIARNNTVAQTVKTQQLWFIIVVAGFKMLNFSHSSLLFSYYSSLHFSEVKKRKSSLTK